MSHFICNLLLPLVSFFPWFKTNKCVTLFVAYQDVTLKYRHFPFHFYLKDVYGKLVPSSILSKQKETTSLADTQCCSVLKQTCGLFGKPVINWQHYLQIQILAKKITSWQMEVLMCISELHLWTDLGRRLYHRDVALHFVELSSSICHLLFFLFSAKKSYLVYVYFTFFFFFPKLIPLVTFLFPYYKYGFFLSFTWDSRKLMIFLLNYEGLFIFSKPLYCKPMYLFLPLVLLLACDHPIIAILYSCW